MPSKTGITISRILLCALLPLALPAPLFARQAKTHSSAAPEPALDALIVRLQSNLDRYRALVPNFFCDEHLVSDMVVRSSLYRRTTTESIFRLKRSGSKSLHAMFIESRQIRTVNKKPAKNQALQGPAILVGAFSNALTAVSLEFRNCYDYMLTSGRKLHRRPVLIVDYTLKKEAARDDKNCPGPEMNSGRAYIDSQTMKVVRLEQTTPHSEITTGIYGEWTWTIDYDQVALNNDLFWMPKKITSTAKSDALDTEWFFVATYRNYHEMTVTSRVLPGVGYNPKE
ncbi:MAG TPA: hypothetical protein VFE22_07475 [Edaphobacter sp.]|nr:hypothetical protein [Edaphobacter sp.]